MRLLGGDSIRLSKSLVTSSAVICVIRPECEACNYELADVSKFVEQGGNANALVFVSSGNPRLLEDLSSQVDPRLRFLYDHRGKWMSRYDIYTFPFNIVVDSNLVVRDVIVGGITQRDIQQLLAN